ncbi:MAG: hypothetical protein GY696_22855 [Gammaproteobacteria bacterium]|nr:hypothetical protein [Gammaproteobacteria bacterium]
MFAVIAKAFGITAHFALKNNSMAQIQTHKTNKHISKATQVQLVLDQTWMGQTSNQ